MFRRLSAIVLTGNEYTLALGTTLVVACLTPLFKRRPRRILNTIFLAQKRVIITLGLTAVGYSN